MKTKLLILFLLVAALHVPARAQQVAVKSNLLTDIALCPAVGVEAGLAKKVTLDLTAQMNFWTIRNHKYKHFLVQPEVRYWLCRRFAGHFFGVHALGGQYNVGNFDVDFKFLGLDFNKLRDHRYEGWAAGAGISYGYAWPVHRHWNIEAEIGLGYVYTRYDTYPCANCGTKIASDSHHNYFGPTKAAVNIVYVF
ncbi:MAG: DUF3575 domain-containing protein [Bacteroidales bacterium]|nr:DUF3575 domain-containing protein [Bacteroidales bacterium]